MDVGTARRIQGKKVSKGHSAQRLTYSREIRKPVLKIQYCIMCRAHYLVIDLSWCKYLGTRYQGTSKRVSKTTLISIYSL